ncbi:MAG TPA: GMC family oxidoreductase N-terminal domain-containing protein [Ramlibacter sp.]|uniref:GMC family oxidoreductase N-terminal domain-containing protein n=1 Tax=Ramlibacter sp. TaxID=1917967 RepID=UPI002ED1102B
MKARVHDDTAPGLRWLSRDYAELRAQADDTVFDVLIVGSGYGGGMAAAELAGREVEEPGGTRRRIRVCVLERGNEYTPGMFPSSLQELPTQVRVRRTAQGRTFGAYDALLDVRLGTDVCTLTGNGLGGTSLINAGVMATPRLEDCRRLPGKLAKALTDDFFEQVKQQLGASDRLLQDHPRAKDLPKNKALQALAAAAGEESRFSQAAITVQVARDEADPDVPPCTLCGDCMTGCNVGAKKSVDTTLLREARRKGAEIYTGGSVIKVKRNGDPKGPWTVRTVYTHESLRQRHWPVDIKARRVILAAGTLGSTEILLRSRTPDFRFSQQLGERFSCNGDNLVALHDGPQVVHATTDESEPLAQRRVGPTITSMIDLGGLLVQEFAVPAPLKRLFDEAVTTTKLLHTLSKPPRPNTPGHGGCDSFAVDAGAMDRTLLVGLIGHDESSGQLQLREEQAADDRTHAEGCLHVHWPGVRRSHELEEAFGRARKLARASGEGVAVLPNPLWRLLPDEMDFLVKGERGPVLTVHPLGGCSMGESHEQGVVDDCGRVFNPAPGPRESGVYTGLAVLDGSVIPASLGANPALTIAAVAKRAAGLLAEEWKFLPAQGEAKPIVVHRRPVYRAPEHCTPPPARPTEVELTERLIGESGPYLLELTMGYKPESVSAMMSGGRPALAIVPARSFLRVYPADSGLRRRLKIASEPQRDEAALLVAEISGSLDIMRQDVDPGRWIRASIHWLANRGTRELWDLAKDWLAGDSTRRMGLKDFKASAARASEARCFDYHVRVERILKSPEGQALLAPGATLRGEKRLTYGLCSNPWRQLTEMRLTEVPAGFRKGTLVLDGRFLVKQGYPLLRIARQENQVVALAELASWAACWARMLLSIHLWSFRAPDPAPAVQRQLLPTAMPKRLPVPAIREIELDPPRRGIPVRLRLTRYASDGPPIALIHGYSASGTTYTHEAIPMPLALYLHQRGHDVWVLDLRTSAGMPSAILPWHFEDAALADLPVALAHISEVRGQRVDVFAHCIGALMLGTALLVQPHELSQFDQVDVADGGPRPKRYVDELAAMRERVGKIVLSQKAPLLVYSDANVLRAYFMKLLRHVVLPEDFQFMAPAGQPLGTGVLDRLLSTMPYPDDEFRRENPLLWKRTPWAGFRHRMDALYARDFSLGNIAGRTLRSVHDLFGPLNLDTVSQAIHFARLNTITDGAGRAIDTQGATLAARWPRHGTLCVHGADNGLADVATLDLFQRHMARAGVQIERHEVAGYGHQDCLIGRHAARDVFAPVYRFLEQAHDQPQPHLPLAEPVRRTG